MHVRLLIIALPFLSSGCGAPLDRPEDRVQPREGCVGEPTQPITAADLERTLRRRGFTVSRVPGEAICDAPVAEQMPVSVSNVIFEGPNENIDQHDDITDREGHLSCGLRRGPIWGWTLDEDLNAPPSSPIFSGEKATFSFANLECTLYPQGERSDEQVYNLQRAVRELAQFALRKRG